MASYQKFQVFAGHLIDGIHDMNGHTFKVFLTNQTPSLSANTVKADLSELAGTGGYTTGGNTTTITTSNTGGVAKAVASNVSWTSTGTIGPFQYAVLYNDTPSSPADPLIAYWDYGSAVTLNNGESLTVGFSQSDGVFTVT